MQIECDTGEQIVKSGMANIMRGIEAVGGKLFLTDRRLAFSSHAFNVQAGASNYALADIDRAETGWTKVFGLIPLAPNALVVHSRTGAEVRFVVWGNKAWAAAINAGAQNWNARF